MCVCVSWLPSDTYMKYDKNTPKTRSCLNLPVVLYAVTLNLRQDLNYLLCAAPKGHNAAFL